jgi:hypothetical protein
VQIDVSARIDLANLAARLTPEQVEALLLGVAKVLAVRTRGGEAGG